MKTLVIIDMQPRFGASDSVVDQVCNLIQLWKDRKWPILLVEYRQQYSGQCGQRTHQVIRDLLRFYRKKWRIFKDQDDGGWFIWSAACKHNLPKHFVLCGVNTCACVQRTALGLCRVGAEEVIKVEVEDVACACSCGCIPNHARIFNLSANRPQNLVWNEPAFSCT